MRRVITAPGSTKTQLLQSIHEELLFLTGPLTHPHIALSSTGGDDKWESLFQRERINHPVSKFNVLGWL